MEIGSGLFGSDKPVRYELLPSKEGSAWLDVDGNNAIDDNDAYLTLHSQAGREEVDFEDLKRVMTQGSPRDDRQVMQELGKMYNEPGLDSINVINGMMNFNTVSDYRQKQSYELEQGRVYLTLTPDPDAPYASPEPEPGVVKLVKDENGVLHWVFPEPAPPPPPPPGALTEATCVKRDGVLHWLFPGECLKPGDEVVGNTDNFEENLRKQMEK